MNKCKILLDLQRARLPVRILTCIIFLLIHRDLCAQNDKFADIGNKPAATRTHLLVTPQPPALSHKPMPISYGREHSFKPMAVLDSEEKLQDSLIAMRARFAPFMQELAPALTGTRIVQSLTTFQWRKETLADKKDFISVLAGEGVWDTVIIPHFGPPLGEAVTYYRTSFTVTNAMLKMGSVFIRFKGVDYKAETFVNGTYAGGHEGIFAPFEFNITDQVKEGENTLVVKVYNDYTMQGNKGDDGRSFDGDKLYAATGPGYDDPVNGWHHCPAGMGIYQGVSVEGRSTLQLQDVFVRPINNSDTAEVWVEVLNTLLELHPVSICHAVFGQNFKETVYEKAVYKPVTIQVPGVGDLVKLSDNAVRQLKMGKGVNFLKFKIVIPGSRKWNNATPWLYQIQLELMDSTGTIRDTRKQQFGMRSFTMDTSGSPKGMMYLNNQPLRLRGANTMGAFQQNVMKADTSQLIDDILIAKITNMNFIRMTQMPVQTEIYDYFDKLGLMTQTDLPLFGVLRRNRWTEAVRQAEEMEKLVRSHPCNIMVTYINERFPNAEGLPQRNLDTYEDFERFFKAADQAVLMTNPDRVIKAGDGDYDPPSPGLPDNHCYNGWYNGHGLGIGEMHKGYWLGVKPNWYYACGEFGSEGLEDVKTMRKYYPASWLPQSTEAERTWIPSIIPRSQTYNYSFMWFNGQNTLNGWVEASQQHQATITRLTTEAFRRDNRMVSFAIHLFIDAFPSGWMKSIMDVDRKPKKAWFEYCHALQPLAVQLRTDRYQFFSGDTLAIEGWVVNDRNTIPKQAVLKYQIEQLGKIYASGGMPASIALNGSRLQGFINTLAPVVAKRTTIIIRMALFGEDGSPLHETSIECTVFPKQSKGAKSVWVNNKQGNAFTLVKELGLPVAATIADADVILIDNFYDYSKSRSEIDSSVNAGKVAVFLELPAGTFELPDSRINVRKCRMGSIYFAECKTGHPVTKGFLPLDFRFWYDGNQETIRPLLDAMMQASGWRSIISTGDALWEGEEQAAAEKRMGKGIFRICQINLPGRVKFNPVANLFAMRLLEQVKY